MLLECFAEGVGRGKREELCNRIDANTLAELLEGELHAPTVKILLGCHVVGGGKLTGNIFAGIAERIAERVHIKGKGGEIVEVGFYGIGDRFAWCLAAIDDG